MGIEEEKQQEIEEGAAEIGRKQSSIRDVGRAAAAWGWSRGAPGTSSGRAREHGVEARW